MTDNRRPNKETRVERSNSKKTPLYKKYWVWLIIVLVIFLIIRIYNAEGTNQTIDELIEQEKEENMNDAGQKEINNSKSTSEEPGDTSSEINYEDFMGTYVTFEGKPYNSPIVPISQNIIELGDNYYRSFNRWDLDMTSTILDTAIEENVLTLHIASHDDEVWGLHSESGMVQFTLEFEGDTKIIYKKGSDDSIYYSMSTEDLLNHYNQQEIDYARIIMTINSVPSLDSWAVARHENEGQKPKVKVSNKKSADGTTITQLELSRQWMLDDLVAYSVVRNGYIKIYDSKESVEEIYIEPFEPYEVADFIGNVEFIYE